MSRREQKRREGEREGKRKESREDHGAEVWGKRGRDIGKKRSK